MTGCATYRSPLHHVAKVQITVKPLPSSTEMLEKERSFVNDGVRTVVFNRTRGLPIIPHYSARRDPSARGYMQSPRVQSVIQYTIEGKERPPKRNRNKLSSRRRCIPTPEQEELADRREGYVRDGVKADSQRTKYHDTLLRPYNALTDPGCRDYFQRKDVQVLLIRTSPRGTSSTSSMTSSMTSSLNSSRSSLVRSGHYSITRNSSPERETTSPRRQNSPGKSHQFSREGTRDNMPVTSNKNNNDNNSNSRNKQNNNNNSKRSPTSPRVPAEPLAEPVRINKLSTRGRCIQTPPPDVIHQREKQFVLDSVSTAQNRNKYRDIIPRYNAVRDVHAKAYFKRDDVQNLMSVTCTVKPWEKDIKDDAKK